jgi:RNA polymerase sigma factor (sigma-70 family)
MTHGARQGTVGAMSVPSSPPTRRRIRDAVGQLSAQERAVLWHAHYLGWSVEQIAEQLDVSIDTVKLRLHEAAVALLGAIRLVT